VPCAETGVRHPDVPKHPAAWVFGERAMRHKRAGGAEVRTQVRQAVRMQLRPGMR